MSSFSRTSIHNLPYDQVAIRERCFHPRAAFAEFKKKQTQQSLPECFEEQVRLYPDRLAVKTRTHQLVYDELNKTANRVAQVILTQRGPGEETIASLFEQGAPAIAAFLGILKAGKICVPLDASLPSDRIAYILRDSGVGLVVSDSRSRSLASKLATNGLEILSIDELDSSLSSENPGLSISPDAPSWIIYTSGSTGRPKGVVQTHRTVLHMTMNYTNTFHICPDDRLTLLFSCSTHGGAYGAFISLLNGAGLYPLDIKQEGVAYLANWLSQQEITICCCVPTVLRQFANSTSGEETFPELRLIYLAGEPVYKIDVDIYKKHFSRDCIFVNRLGSTETDVISMYFMDKNTQITGNNVPVGYAPDDKEVLLIGDDGDQVGIDTIGEIVVKSRYISPGYWQRPDLTQAAYLPASHLGGELIYRTGDLGRRLPNGCLVHLGRKDFQVQIRGYRVEAGEIETVLLTLDSVKEAVVVAREDEAGNQRLIAYIVGSKQSVPTVSELRRAISEKLPDYMVPSVFVTLDALPQAPNGKVNRRALPPPGSARPDLDNPFVAPSTPVEETLAHIWANVLSLGQVGIYDNFQELGGDSLLATRVISQVISTFRVEVPLRSLFEAPTVADMAVVVTQMLGKMTGQQDTAGILAEVEALSDAQAKRILDDETGGIADNASFTKSG